MLIDLENYMIQGEPDQKERGFNWHTAVGLQQTDGLKTSDFLIATANRNINGDITLEEAKKLIDGYYETKPAGHDDKSRTEEADKVSARITQLLSEKTFSFSPAEYIIIHRRLFEGIYRFAGKIRDYNISKKEWVLNGETVYYASAVSVRATLEYDFTQEKKYNYKGLSMVQTSEHIARFVSGLWQIHAFGEGNTRTTAVFIIKYLRSLGFDATNDIFAENAWYFRNALVRANYNNYKSGVHATQEYLNRFFGNLLLGEKNVLRNRDLHTSVPVNDRVNDHVSTDDTLNDRVNDRVNTDDTLNDRVNDRVNDTVNKGYGLSAIQQEVLLSLSENPHATAVQLAGLHGISEKTVRRVINTLKTANLIERIGSDKKGHWLVKNPAFDITP